MIDKTRPNDACSKLQSAVVIGHGYHFTIDNVRSVQGERAGDKICHLHEIQRRRRSGIITIRYV